jgi:hypothetical protein
MPVQLLTPSWEPGAAPHLLRKYAAGGEHFALAWYVWRGFKQADVAISTSQTGFDNCLSAWFWPYSHGVAKSGYPHIYIGGNASDWKLERPNSGFHGHVTPCEYINPPWAHYRGYPVGCSGWMWFTGNHEDTMPNVHNMWFWAGE